MREECFICGAYTGKAGKGDGSIYWAQSGPWCEECSDVMRAEVEADSGIRDDSESVSVRG